MSRSTEKADGHGEILEIPRSTISESPLTHQPFRPFPVGALPEPFDEYVSRSAHAIGCDESMVAMPTLATLAATIGNARCVGLKPGWTEPSIVWSAIVSDSGTLKSPAIASALMQVQEVETRELALGAKEQEQHQDELLRYDCHLREWKQAGGNGIPPTKPTRPQGRRRIVSDVTIEALALLLRDNWRGLLLVRDELSGWFGSFDRYTSKTGGDVAHWLEMYGARRLVFDRKTGDDKTIVVPRASVSITGGIQPRVLASAFGQANFENGLASRFLLAMPPRRRKRWTEQTLDSSTSSAASRVIETLYALEAATDAEGQPTPIPVALQPDARREWIRFYNDFARRQEEASGNTAAALSKLEGYTARFALLHHLAREAHQGHTAISPSGIDLASIQAAIQLTSWFGDEAIRVYTNLRESAQQAWLRRSIEKIQLRGGVISAREWQRSESLESADRAREELDRLAEHRLGSWESRPPGPRGGRPTRVLLLRPDLRGPNPLEQQHGRDPQESQRNRGANGIDQREVAT